MKIHTTLFAVTVAVAALSAAGVATAHNGMGPGMGMRGGQGPEAAASVATRLAAGKAALKITADQEAAWGKYAGVMTQLAQAHDAMRTQMQAQMQAQGRDGKVPSAEEAAKQRDAMIKLRTEHQAQRAVAVKDLYAVLTPEQRAIAEEYLQGHRGHRMAGHMGGHGGGHGGGQGRHGGGGMVGR